jgi:hypothetical protein
MICKMFLSTICLFIFIFIAIVLGYEMHILSLSDCTKYTLIPLSLIFIIIVAIIIGLIATIYKNCYLPNIVFPLTKKPIVIIENNFL